VSPRVTASAALEAVLANFAALVRRVGWRHRLSAADVDELMQEVRVRLWRVHADDGEKIEAVSPSYVYQTAVSAALDLMRRRRARQADMHESGSDAFDHTAAPGGPDRDLAASELARTVARAIDTIPATRRPVVRMYLAGYPREEIATLLGWTEAKTRNLLYRGLDDLRARLAEWGVDPRGRHDR
jgi:RNA polymerase sigma-70 factor (ECF subfamily)